MSDLDDRLQCAFCRKGHIFTRNQQIAFRQWTDRGYVHCQSKLRSASATTAQASIGTRRRKPSSMTPCGANTTTSGPRHIGAGRDWILAKRRL